MAIIRQSSKIKGSRSQLRSHNEATGSLLAGLSDVDGAGLRQVGGDTEAPTAPVLTATAISSSQINLSWTASTDNVGVASYTLQRSGDNVNWTTLYVGLNRTYSDTGLSSAATYHYRARASDAAGNVSAYGTDSAVTASNNQATFIISTANTSSTRTFDGANLTTGFNGSAWVTTQGTTRLPQAGDIIELAAGQHVQFQLRFQNLNGNSNSRIIVRGPQTGTTQAVIRRLAPAVGNFVWRLTNCNHMTIDGYLPSAGAFNTAPYNCGIKITYALNSIAGLGTTNKDGPSYYMYWGDTGPAVHDVTLQYTEIDGGWAYASPAVDSTGSGSGYAYEGIGLKIGSVKLVNGDGSWNERIKLLHNWCHATQGKGFYQGRNSDVGSIPWRDHEMAYNLFEDCGGGAMHQKLMLEGDNRCHHNVIKRCGLVAPTPSRWAITNEHMSTTKIYNNWIEDNALGSTRVNGQGRVPGGIHAYVVDTGPNVPAPGGTYLGYGPYTTQQVWIYNNVVIRAGNQVLTDAGDAGPGIKVSAGNGAKLRHTPYIFNNTVLDCFGTGIDVSNKVDGGFIKNNIVLGNAGSQIVTDGVAPATNNLTTGSASSLFVNYAGDDFRLASPDSYPATGTIGVDIAATGFGALRTDQQDTTRPAGGSADIGAYEK